MSPASGVAALYRRLADAHSPDASASRDAANFLRSQLAQVPSFCDLPDSPLDLQSWMHGSAQVATARYSAYLDERQAGSPRRYFKTRAQALYFLRAVAPTKLVDGAWLYGLMTHSDNARFGDLIQTYLEELGEGQPDKNHVAVYRRLMANYGIDEAQDLDDAFYLQGAIQLALSCNAENFLPELIGFNLGYEQLPLHLLITAYELNELGLDPYYFTLHVTVDNSDSGHARRAVQAVLDNLPRLGGADGFWQRVRAGYQLSNAGLATPGLIESFDIESEIVRIFSRKSTAGHGAHSDYCRVAGRKVNDWLAEPEDVPQFLAALEQTGWIKHGEAFEDSRFWKLLVGERAEMFGVFSGYELQVIEDWMRSTVAGDVRACSVRGEIPTGQTPGFRAASRLAAAREGGDFIPRAAPSHESALLDSDLQQLQQQWPLLDAQARKKRLVDAMAPSLHWTPAGLHATRLFFQSRCWG